ncbi:MAG: hypothetical protein H6621_01770 [Halobacteriovoraceae bacterium]|nr:hypothetical protein [Halobacteriovoraceae bacterium]MCB9093770.1 hypothetical protein [Halobacteriovoraceae bacterium]
MSRNLFVVFTLLLSQLITLGHAQDKENPLHWTGLTRFSLEGRTYNIQKLNGMKNQSQVLVGVQSRGIPVSQYSQSAVVPFEFEVIVEDQGKFNIREYQFGLFRTGNLHNINLKKKRRDAEGNVLYNADGEALYDSHDIGEYNLTLDLVQFDREAFRETALDYLAIERLNFLEVNFKGAVRLGEKHVKLVFGGKFAPLHSSRSTHSSREFEDLLAPYSNGRDLYPSESLKTGSLWSKISGAGPEVYNSRSGKFSYDGFLGDTDLMVGLDLFKYIEANFVYKIDSASGINDLYFLQMDSRISRYNLNVDLGQVFKRSKKLDGLTFFGYFQKERSKLSLFEANPGIQDSYFKEIDNSIWKRGGIGVRWNIPVKKQKFQKVSESLY